MPTHVTYALPGHHGAGEGMPPRFSMTLTVHSQVTFPAPRVRNRLTMCRQAATNSAGGRSRNPRTARPVHLMAEADDHGKTI